MEGDRAGRNLNKVLSPTLTRDYDKFMALKEDLLPGIPNDVTFDHITKKIPWTTIRTLSSVSRAWKQAIQDRLIHEALVRTHSAETVAVVVSHPLSSGPNEITLYSWSDKVSYQLPPIPQIDTGFPRECHCIPLDGKMYILGGITESDHRYESSNKVYVLDVAGQGKWEQCSSMQVARHSFACGVLNGKIYVFGGTAFISTMSRAGVVDVFGSEVYDPKVNAWCAIRPMTTNFDYPVATTVGGELWVYSNIMNPSLTETLEVYNPVKDDWRRLFTWRRGWGFEDYIEGVLFVAHEKLCSMTSSAICAYDVDIHSWTRLHSFSFSKMFGRPSSEVRVHSVLAVDDKLLATLGWEYPPIPGRNESENYLVQSTGLGGKDEEILWEKATCYFPPDAVYYDHAENSLHSVQL